MTTENPHTPPLPHGTERIASRLGNQNLPINVNDPELQDRKDQLDSNIRRNIADITGYEFLPVGEEQDPDDPKHIPQGRYGSQFWQWTDFPEYFIYSRGAFFE